MRKNELKRPFGRFSHIKSSKTKKFIKHIDIVGIEWYKRIYKILIGKVGNKRKGGKPVSYTHLDVYKRQVHPTAAV